VSDGATFPWERPDRFGWWLGATVLLGALLRFPTLGQQSLWTDEATTWGIVAHGLGHVIATVPRTESTPPDYYVLLWLWSRVFGLGAAGLRSLSAVFGVATIWVLGLTGRRLVDERLGLAAATLTAVSPIMVWYSQEARAYALVILFSALSLLLLLRALERPDSRRLLAWGLCAAVALSVHYFAIFVVVPEAVWLLAVLWQQRRWTAGRLLLCLGPAVVVGAALLPLLVHQADSGHASFIATTQGSLPRRLVRLGKEDVLGLDEPLKALLSLVAGLLLVLSVAGLARAARSNDRRTLAVGLGVGVGGVALALLTALAGFDYIDTRNLLPTWPALALVLAGGLTANGSGRVGGLGLCALFALSLTCVISIVVTPLDQRANWRGVSQRLGPATETRVIVGDRLSYTSLAPYVPRLVRVASGQTVAVREVDVFGLALDKSPPPRAARPPSLPGFRLVEQVRTDTFTLFRYVAASATSEPAVRLVALGLMPGRFSNVVLEQPVR
jgi:mannosyltransferase